METPPPSSPRPQGSPWMQDDCSDGYSTPTSPTHHHAKILLRQQENEREQLRIDNFNRALRINYLEEQLLRLSQGLGFGSEQLESEVIQLRSSLDQRERDLRRRDSAMTRATQAMDLLSSRLKEAQEQVKQAKKHAQDQLQAQRQQFRQEQRDMEAKLTEKWQAQVENAYEREMSSQDAMQMLEIQLERQNQVVQAVTTQLEEMKDAERRLESEMEQCQRQREQETREEMEVFRTKLEAEIEHWKAVSTEREEEMTKLRLQMETMRQQLVGEKESLRLQNVKLMADSAEQIKAIDSFRADQQVALRTIQQLESQLYEMRMLDNEHEFTIKTLESRLKHAELIEKSRRAMVNESIEQERESLKAEMERLAEDRQQFVGETEQLRLENVKLTTACEELKSSLDGLKTDNERLLALEKDLQVMKEDNFRLRQEVSGFQMEREAMEHKLQDSEKRFSSTWSIRYEDLSMRKEEERRSLEEEIRYFQTKMTKAEEALGRANRNIQALKRSSREEAQHDVDALKESNRLLFEEVQECRKSAKHARNQYRQAVRENKDLLKAIATYKDAIAGRDKDIEKYKAAVMKHARQLKRRGEFGEVEQTLKEQLKQTQYMITETYKRWKDSPIVRGPVVNASDKEEMPETAILQLNAFVRRMHVVSERWGDFLTQSQELHRRYGKQNAWKSASRGFDYTEDQSRWADDVDQKCSQLLTEAVRTSEAMRDVANNILDVLQKEQNEKQRTKKEGVVSGDNNTLVKQRDDTSSAWLSRDSDYFDGNVRLQSHSRRHFESLTKQDGFDTPCRNPTPSASSRCSVTKRYGSSLSSLVRVGIKVHDLETEIQRAHD